MATAVNVTTGYLWSYICCTPYIIKLSPVVVSLSIAEDLLILNQNSTPQSRF